MCRLPLSLKTPEHYVDSYLDYLVVERRYSSHTRENYSRALHQLLAFLKKEREGRHILQADTADLRAFLAHLKAERSLKRISQLNRLSALKNFFRYLRRKELYYGDPTEGLGSLRAEKKLPGFLVIDEVRAFLGYIEKKAHTKPCFLHIRNLALFELLYSSGIRVSELTALKLGHLDFSNRTVRVRGKGGKERIVPFNRRAAEALHTYLPLRENMSRGQVLFLNYAGKPLGPRGVRTILNVLAREAGLNKPVSPHTFRHSYATHLLGGGAELRTVQEALGHASLSTTQIYTHVNWENMKTVYMDTHPRSRRKMEK